MKFAKVLMGATELNGILVSSLKDITEIESVMKEAENEIVTKFVKSGEPAHRLNHIVDELQDIPRAIASLAVTKSVFDGKPAYYKVGNAAEAYLGSLVGVVTTYGEAFIQPKGGITPKGAYEVLEVKEEQYSNKGFNYQIVPSEVMNLENSKTLETTAIEQMQSIWGKYSWVTDLRRMSDVRLKRVLEEFVAQGGKYLYLYTTGQDVNQMYEYSTIAARVGIQKMYFRFTQMNPEIEKFVTTVGRMTPIEILSNPIDKS